MKDPATVDELLADIVSISARIDASEPDTAERARLEQQREELRTAARKAGDSARSDAVLRNELGILTKRLTEIDARPIDKGWTEKTSYRWFNDPGAYSSQINRMIESQDAAERESIVTRIAEIETALAERANDR